METKLCVKRNSEINNLQVVQGERSVIYSFFFEVYEEMSAFMMNILNICFLKPSKLVHRFSDIRAKSLHSGQCLGAGVSSKYLKM